MRSSFRFFLVCHSAKTNPDGTLIIRDVLNRLRLKDRHPIDLMIVAGVYTSALLANKRLKVTHWKLEDNIRQVLPFYGEQFLVLPGSYRGPHNLTMKCKLQFLDTATYGFDLTDEDGAFELRNVVLARFAFDVVVD